MSCDIAGAVITRFRGDDDPHKMLITVKKFGEEIKTPLDLSLVISDGIKFGFKLKDSVNTPVVYTCVPDADPKTGIIEIPFHADNVGDKGDYDYDVSVVWAANNKKKTLIKNLLILEDDVNKT